MKALWFAAALCASSLASPISAYAAPVAPDGLASDDLDALMLDVKKGWGRGHGGNPPGWGHGRKRGWGGYGMPPGQYRKRHRYYHGRPMLNTPYYF